MIRWLVVVLCFVASVAHAQEVLRDEFGDEIIADSIATAEPLTIAEPLIIAESDSIATDLYVAEPDTLRADDLLPAKSKRVKMPKEARDWTTWVPSPKRAMWLAMVFPGGGQIYNRKYWKLPIFYGGFVGCAYAWSWNNQMYQDYKQAYLDITDDDDSTDSYNSFLHLGATVTSSNLSRYQTLFSKRKDRFRRYRDLSFFCLLGVYGLSIIDAYVDASLSEFDISDDLTLQWGLGVVGGDGSLQSLGSSRSGVGLNCCFTF